jgi:hypothetical protein
VDRFVGPLRNSNIAPSAGGRVTAQTGLGKARVELSEIQTLDRVLRVYDHRYCVDEPEVPIGPRGDPDAERIITVCLPERSEIRGRQITRNEGEIAAPVEELLHRRTERSLRPEIRRRYRDPGIGIKRTERLQPFVDQFRQDRSALPSSFPRIAFAGHGDMAEAGRRASVAELGLGQGPSVLGPEPDSRVVGGRFRRRRRRAECQCEERQPKGGSSATGWLSLGN